MIPITPQLFDTLGVLVFFYLTAMALWGLGTKKCLPQWANIILLLIGVSGLLIDGFITYVYFLEQYI